MSRVRIHFYNDPSVEADAVTADKDALALDFVGTADIRLPNEFLGLSRLLLAYRLQKPFAGAAFGGRDSSIYMLSSSFPNSAIHPICRPRNCDTRGVCLQEEYLCKRLYWS